MLMLDCSTNFWRLASQLKPLGPFTTPAHRCSILCHQWRSALCSLFFVSLLSCALAVVIVGAAVVLLGTARPTLAVAKTICSLLPLATAGYSSWRPHTHRLMT